MSNAALQTETQAPTTELVLLSSVPAKIQFNLQEFRQNIRNELKKYDLVVTVDTVKDAKALAADLNGQAKSLKDRFKEAAALVTKPVDDLGLEVADIVTEILASREKITAQIKKFEDERKVVVRNAIEEKRLELWDQLEVQEEFRKSTVSHLATLGALTKGGALTTGTLSKVKDLVSNDKSMQLQTEARLMKLENLSYREGLKAPLTRAHVESFLFESDTVYTSNLAVMMTSEKKRQDKVEESFRQNAALESQRALQEAAQTAEPERQPTEIEVLEQSIADSKERLPYSEGQSYRDSERAITQAQLKLADMKSQPTVKPENYVICSLADTAQRLGSPISTIDPNEAIQAALSESADHSIFAAVWSQTQGRVAIVDGLTGDVYQRVGL